MDTAAIAKKMTTNDTDFYAQAAGVALEKLVAMYGTTLNQQDISRVVDLLESVKLELPADYKAAVETAQEAQSC